MNIILWMVAGIVALMLLGSLAGPPTPQHAQSAAPSLALNRAPSVSAFYEPRSPVHIFATVRIDQWKRGGFNTVALVDLTVTNSGERGMKDIQMTCQLVAESGTVLASIRHTLYITLPPKASRRQREVNLGLIHPQGRRLGCDVTGATEI
jgi:hypothetical protein